MKLDRDIESFINNYVKALKEKNAVAFIGSGMSVSQGFSIGKTIKTSC
ncbi:hypothetical protein K7J14_00045 [Treponema zuelzerae]|uniref:Uncharacterized protein n=1 Tax=Teretinema zuelzerae TaxID=156 RepID=A0AAE3EFE5_9SPIR|nr:hypothetical protein [Teretinema zuelzerae]MCD1653100.1 hypothetical protein [Teretinema zuelzerae]